VEIVALVVVAYLALLLVVIALCRAAAAGEAALARERDPARRPLGHGGPPPHLRSF
jgi:hypothetical protein